jgi:hypothetical protein
MALWGFNGLIELPPIESGDPRTGKTITRTWHGPMAQAVTARNELIAKKQRYTFQPDADGQGATVGVILGAEETQPPGEALSDRVSQVTNEIQLSIWALKKVTDELLKITNIKDRAMWRSWVESFAAGQFIVLDGQGHKYEIESIEGLVGVASKLSSGRTDNKVLTGLIETLCLGVDSKTVTQWVIRRVIVIAANSTIRPNYHNVDRLFRSTEELIAREGLPPDSDNNPYPPAAWLKKGPHRDQIEADKWQISYEYWSCDWWLGWLWDAAQ